MDKIRIALIGAGKIAESAHVPSILKNEHAELVVIVDRSSGRSKDLINTFRLKTAHVEDISQYKGKVDAAIICTPNDTHVDICLQCFLLGIHVLVEKPLSNTYKDALLIEKKANEANCIVMVGYCTRFWPSVQKAKHLLNSKHLGNITKFVFQFGSAGGWAPVSNYILSKEKSGGGAFIINGSHYLDRMIDFFGIPSSFTYLDDAIKGVEANAVAEFIYNEGEQNFKGIIRASKTVNLKSGCFIECENGTIIHKDWEEPVLSIKYNLGNEVVKLSLDSDESFLRKRSDMYLLQLDELIQKIRNGNKDTDFSSFKDSITNVKMTENLYNIKKPLKCDWYYGE